MVVGMTKHEPYRPARCATLFKRRHAYGVRSRAGSLAGSGRSASGSLRRFDLTRLSHVARSVA